MLSLFHCVCKALWAENYYFMRDRHTKEFKKKKKIIWIHQIPIQLVVTSNNNGKINENKGRKGGVFMYMKMIDCFNWLQSFNQNEKSNKVTCEGVAPNIIREYWPTFIIVFYFMKSDCVVVYMYDLWYRHLSFDGFWLIYEWRNNVPYLWIFLFSETMLPFRSKYIKNWKRIMSHSISMYG